MYVSSAPLLIQIFASGPGVAANDGPNVWVPATHVRDLEEAASSWLQPGPVLAFVAIWRVIQQKEDLSVSPYNSDFQSK